MTDFLLELLTEEIPARMQAAAAAQLAARFTAGVAAAALPIRAVAVLVTPRRLALIVADVADASAATRDERRGPRADAPEGAIAGFLKSTGLTRDQLEERDTPKGRFLYATVATPGRAAAAILAELIPAIVRDFDWPKSMRWGDASASTASPRWVRPLSGIVALLGDAVVPLTAAGVTSGRTTVGHRFMSTGAIEITAAATYVDQLRAAHVMLDPAERAAVIVAGAEAAAAAAGLGLIADAGLVAENAGLTEWPVPLLGRFDPAFLEVPREIIQLTMRTNQKYFACTAAASASGGALAPAFVCVANLAAADGGAAIVAGNRKVLAARLADAKFFWDADVARVRADGLAGFTPKLAEIVFHEKLGTVADKVERVAKLARWLVESGVVAAAPLPLGGGARDAEGGPGVGPDRAEYPTAATAPPPGHAARVSRPSPEGEGRPTLADLAEQAARLCKADLVSATVGEFPEVQGIAGGHLALAEGLDPQVAAAIRDHYKPVGPSDAVPTAPVTVAVALADKLDTLVSFFAIDEKPTGSRDPFALRRAALGIIDIIIKSKLRIGFREIVRETYRLLVSQLSDKYFLIFEDMLDEEKYSSLLVGPEYYLRSGFELLLLKKEPPETLAYRNEDGKRCWRPGDARRSGLVEGQVRGFVDTVNDTTEFFFDRLRERQRRQGRRHDLISAVLPVQLLDVFEGLGLGTEWVKIPNVTAADDPNRILDLSAALQAVLQTPDGASLLAGYRRGANIVRIEEGKEAGVSDGAVDPDLLTEPAEIALNGALDAAVPAADAAVAAEDFTAAMTALARLRPAVDAFFEHVTVNANEAAVRRNRLALLARLRTAVHAVADFSKLQD